MREDYGFIPLVVGVGAISALLAGGTAYYVTKKIYENRYYDCLTEMTKKGYSIDKAKSVCILGKRPSILQQLALVPIISLFSYGIFKTLTEGR